MRFGKVLTVLLVAGLVGRAAAQDAVGVSGSGVLYPVTMKAEIGDKKVQTKLTGCGMRKKAGVINVYTIGSYVAADFKGGSPEDLANADVVKQLHLILQRNVDGRDMAEAFMTAVRANYPTEFGPELQKFTSIMQAQNVEKGDVVWITHIPGYGIHVNLVGKRSEFIKNPKFSKAVWDIYLGPKNVGEALKKGLTSRL